MNAPVTNLPTTTERRSVLITMASKYSMEPAAFEQTLRKTVVPETTTKEQFAAFLVVANEYGLNPLTKEIYAFPARTGGIQPIVSIDGWLNIVNSHPMLNGIEFDDHLDKDGKIVTAITCRIWRKDREKPIVVTEYLAECNRPTDPWKQYPRRMLRHKALIQCARYAFGFAGIVDPDEAERIGDASPMRDVSPARNGGPPAPNSLKPAATEHKAAIPMAAASATRDGDLELAEAGRHEPGQEVWGDEPQQAQAATLAPQHGDGIPEELRRLKPSEEAEWLNELAGALSGAEDMVTLGEKQRDVMKPMKGRVSGDAWAKAQALIEDHLRRIQENA